MIFMTIGAVLGLIVWIPLLVVLVIICSLVGVK